MRRPVLCALAFALLGLLVAVAPHPAVGAVKAKRETYQAFLVQLNHGQVKSVVLVPKKTTLHAKLKNGTKYVAKYPASDRKRIVALLHQRNVHVAFAKPKKKKKQSSRIRRRYIALAVVGVGALAAGGWYFTRRRRPAG